MTKDEARDLTLRRQTDVREGAHDPVTRDRLRREARLAFYEAEFQRLLEERGAPAHAAVGSVPIGPIGPKPEGPAPTSPAPRYGYAYCHCLPFDAAHPDGTLPCGCADPDCTVRLYRDAVVHWQGAHWRLACAFEAAVRLLEERS